MERRKFVIGLGSLAAGGAAATGTGALSSTAADRTATGEIVADDEAYIRLVPYGENSEFASQENGQLVLNFGDGGENAPLNNQGKSNGLGLNADSVNEFDSVFRITANDNGGAFDVWVESNSDHLSFYWSNKKSGAATKQNSIELEAASGANTSVNVGVRIDLDDVDQPQTVLNGNDNFTIHAEDADE
ncbi:DUF1102 domain-containing protein [Halorubrum sp. Eb13]|uniref:DUF1102 domain-containing protein n=1 Tax=Halorubrum sp. Eb13 TaxID=1383843 RepID=UPI001595E7FE|nr:DUF1102 domain-containing protein [Halorubrum sp. Eb13]